MLRRPVRQVGNNVKVINSVLMDGCVVRDSCHVQNSIVCAGCELQVGSARCAVHAVHVLCTLCARPAPLLLARPARELRQPPRV